MAEVERLSELRCKEVINIRDGSRYGYVGDMELEMDSGRGPAPGSSGGGLVRRIYSHCRVISKKCVL